MYWRRLPRWFGMSATSPTVPLNVVSSSCAVQALRIIQLHLVQYSIAIRGDLMVIGLLAIATTVDDARLAPECLTDRGPASRLREDGSSASTNHITCRIDRIETRPRRASSTGVKTNDGARAQGVHREHRGNSAYMSHRNHKMSLEFAGYWKHFHGRGAAAADATFWEKGMPATTAAR